MTGAGALLLALAAGSSVLLLTHPGPRVRRFPEDADPNPGGGGSAVGRFVTSSTERRGRRPQRSDPDDRAGLRGGHLDPGDPADLAACCDLLAVAAGSGLNVADSIRAVGAVSPGPVGTMLESVADEVDRGGRLVEVLARRSGTVAAPVRPLVTTLVTTAVSGSPAAPSLQRLADAERRRSRRRTEARIRRLPVLLLLPLVGLVLPAFVLLTLVPAGLSAAVDTGVGAPTTTRSVSPDRSRRMTAEEPRSPVASPDTTRSSPSGGRP